MRRVVLDRDGWVCRLQLPGCTHNANEVHHTRGRSVTGDDPKYLVASCKQCNLRVGDPTRHTPARPQRWSSWG
jgi:hypothetical protein